MRGISLLGNAGTRDRLLRRELEVATGDPLRWNKVETSRRQLLSTGLFRDVEIVPAAIDSAAGEADLEVRVIERKPAYYELGVGGGQPGAHTLAAGLGAQ